MMPQEKPAATQSPSATAPLPPAVEVRNLTVAYDQHPVLRAVSFTCPTGQIVGVVGPNGAGKSTLFKAMLGLVKPTNGSVRLFGGSVDAHRSRIAYVPQRETVDWDYPATVADVVLMGRYGRLGWLRRPTGADRDRVVAALGRVNMQEYAHRQIGQLSGGQQQRVFLARALVQEADLLMLDEPFVGVDAATEEVIYDVMSDLRDQGNVIMVVNHDLSVIQERYDRLMLLNGRLVAYGPPEQAFTPENLRATYGGRLAFLEQATHKAVKSQ